MSWWEVLDVTGWKVEFAEPRGGKRPKQWLRDANGAYWLRKLPLAWRPHEIVVEVLTLELASRLGFEVAHGRVCTWADGGRGLASRKFHGDDEDQYSGGDLVATELNMPCDTDSEEKRTRPFITIDVVRRTLERYGAHYGVDFLKPFLRMLVFDAWIGNSDRHSGNWAILTGRSSARLAPMYDTAGCLGAELGDEKLAAKLLPHERDAALKRYVDACPSGFGDGHHATGLLQRDLIPLLREWPECPEIAPAFIAELSRGLALFDELLAEIPSDWFPAERKTFARSVLAARATLVEGAFR